MSKPPSNDSIGFRELLPIAFWVVKIHLALARKWTIVSALSRFLAELRPIVYTYIIAQLINQVIITASSGDNLEDLTIYLVALFVYGLVSRTVGFIEGYANTRLNWDIDTGLRRMLYSKMHSLGVQTLEQPGVVNRATRAKENIQHVQRYMFDLIKFFGSLVRMTSTGAIIFSVIPAAGALLLVFAIPKALIQKHFMKKDWHIHRDMTEGRRKAHAAAGMLTEASVHEISVLNAFRHIDRVFIDFYTKYIGRVMHNRKGGTLVSI
jgi:ABC-type multidrug transport system fused ATPase/permease subunit